MVALPAAAFTASVLFDVLALVADHPEQVQGYLRGSADLLRLGLGTSLASVALEVADYLQTPPGESAPKATRKLAVNGAIIAIYLLDLAERQKNVGAEHGAGHNGRTEIAVLPVGLSLLGLSLLGVAANLEH